MASMGKFRLFYLTELIARPSFRAVLTYNLFALFVNH